jgi:Kef-type K+ transport system membrane component KefB
VLGTRTWIKFLSGLGPIVLTFLAGAELDVDVFDAGLDPEPEGPSSSAS